MSGRIRLTIFLSLALSLMAFKSAFLQDALAPKFYYLKGEQVYRYDPALQSHDAVNVGTAAALYNAAVSPDGHYLAYMEENGTLRWIDLQTDQVTTFPPRPTPSYFWPETEPYTSYVVPLAWSSTGKLLLNQAIWEGGYLGWTSVDEPYWHDFPPRPAAPDLTIHPPDPNYYGLGYEAWSSDGDRLLFASGGPGTVAFFLAGLTLIDFENDSASRIVSESILYPPDGTSLTAGTAHPSWSHDDQWIAFTMQTNIIYEAGQTYFPNGLYIARPDGTERKLITQDSKTEFVGCTTWSGGGSLAYVYLDTESSSDPTQWLGDLYVYQPGSEQLAVAVSDIGCPLGLSRDGRFISYFQGNDLLIMDFNTQEKMKIVGESGTTLSPAGWTME